jgi:hypothetical protein
MADALIIESSNFLFMVIGAFAVWRVVCWKLKNQLSEHNESIIWAWVWCFSAASANHAWFALSRHTAPEGVIWNPAMYEWRWLVVCLTSLAFSWGVLSFIRLIDDHGYKRQAAIFGASFIAAYGLGFL